MCLSNVGAFHERVVLVGVGATAGVFPRAFHERLVLVGVGDAPVIFFVAEGGPCWKRVGGVAISTNGACDALPRVVVLVRVV